MAPVLLVLGLLAYLFLLIDWPGMRFALAQGGWASACLYVVLAILITVALTSSPDLAAHAPAAHHG